MSERDGLLRVLRAVHQLSAEARETEVDEEGCLSLPGISVPVERSVSVVCEALDLEGKKVRIERNPDTENMLDPDFSLTSRPCPPRASSARPR